MLHFLDEWEVFAVLSLLMKRKAWLNQGESEMTASQMTLHSLLQSHTVSELTELCVIYTPLFSPPLALNFTQLGSSQT